MGTRTEFDISTGQTRQVNATAYMVGDAIVLIDEGQPIPSGALSPPPVDTNTAPHFVTRRQALLALLAAGKLDAVELQIRNSPRDVQITWEAAQDFERTNPLIKALAPQVGLTESDIDALFAEAAKL